MSKKRRHEQHDRPQGVTKAAIMSKSGCTDRQVDDYVEVGLIGHPEGSGRAGYIYSPRSITRARISRERLSEARDYREAALELLLRGIDPASPSALRDALLLHLDQKAAAYSFRLRQHDSATTPYSERRRIERALEREAEANAYSDELREIARAVTLSLNGLTRPQGTLHGTIPLAVPSYAEQREIVKAAGDTLLSEAAAITRREIPRDMWLLINRWNADNSWREEDQVRALLAGHVCTQRHTIKQAARPVALISTLLRLDPGLIPESLHTFLRNPLVNLEHCDQIAPAALKESGDLVRYVTHKSRREVDATQ